MPNSILDSKEFSYVKEQMNRRNQLYNLYFWFYMGSEYDHPVVRRVFALYAAIREFYAMVSQVVDIDVQLVPGGWQTTANQEQVDSILLKAGWQDTGDLLVHYGALFGDFYLNIAKPDQDYVLQPLDPRGAWLAEDYGLVIRNLVDKEGISYEYAELLNDQWIYIFKDGKLTDQSKHTLGIIPLLYGQNKNVGAEMGLNSFHNVVNQLNAVNEMATYLQEQILRNLAPQKIIEGAMSTEMDYGPDKTMFLPLGAKLHLITGEVDIAGALDFLKDIKAEVRKSLPEFIWENLRIPGLQRPDSADALRLYAQELAAKIRRLRVGYDATLKQAVDIIANAQGITLGDWYFDPDRSVFMEFQTTPTQAVTEENINGRREEV